MVLFIGAESGSVLVFVEVKLLVGFGFCKSLKVGILYRTYEKVSRPGPCNFNGDHIISYIIVYDHISSYMIIYDHILYIYKSCNH